MANEDLDARILRAKELLKTAKYAAMATVNEDGTPHNSPFYLILDKDLRHVYFGSHPDSRHSKNVARNGNMFVVLYSATERGGLYMKAVEGHELSGQELELALTAHNDARASDGKMPLEQGYFEGDSPQRMYGARLTDFWVNTVIRGGDGLVIRESREQVMPKDLLV